MANLFSRKTNWLPLKLLIIVNVIGMIATAGVYYYFTPKYTRVGYEPMQPVAFQHDIHAKQLGIDCRYCHSYVEVSAHSNIPTTQVCMGCHSQVQKGNPKLKPVYDSWTTGKPVEWVQIHKTPDYVYFNHAVHVNRGVSCYSCHGQVNDMKVVFHDQSLSMAWCLECHRNPENFLRPRDQVFNLDWHPPTGTSQHEMGLKLKQAWKVNPPEDCAGCHR